MALGLTAGQSLAGQAVDTLGVHWGFGMSAVGAAVGAVLVLVWWSIVRRAGPAGLAERNRSGM